ncbi:uncharacterized protein BDW43DRAFT_178981 [Aspergillus alliaceus]|nr:uncharacterized protein BDW43DRAFT_178981 [Aspergillus alliaceus]KAB8237486.1 hypothetical protein BDW43DRAFT_178981 [Aspergillus alliaceus]
MDIYFTNSDFPSDQNDQWLIKHPLLPVGSWLIPCDCSMSPSHARLQSTGSSLGETCSLDTTEGFLCDTPTCPKDLGVACYEAPASLRSSHETMNLTHKQLQLDKPAKPPIDRSVIMDASQQPKPEPIPTSVTPISDSDPSPANNGRLKPIRKRLVPQDSAGQHNCSFTSSDKVDSDLRNLRKKAHNEVERRYRADLNARFKQLEDATKQETATAGPDVKSTRGLRQGRKALILQNAYDRIISLQTELQTLHQMISTL